MKTPFGLLALVCTIVALAGCDAPTPPAPTATVDSTAVLPPDTIEPTMVRETKQPTVTHTPISTPLPAVEEPTESKPPRMALNSTAFEHEGDIPLRYAQRTFEAAGGWTVTCPGQNVSPPLYWSNVPPAAKSLAITALDHITLCKKCERLAPEGRVWGHWGLYNVAPSTTELPEDMSATLALPSGARQVMNEYGEVGYGGPCPPPDHAHYYVFTLYALDTEIALPEDAGVMNLAAALEGHILAEAELVGVFIGR